MIYLRIQVNCLYLIASMTKTAYFATCFLHHILNIRSINHCTKVSFQDQCVKIQWVDWVCQMTLKTFFFLHQNVNLKLFIEGSEVSIAWFRCWKLKIGTQSKFPVFFVCKMSSHHSRLPAIPTWQTQRNSNFI